MIWSHVLVFVALACYPLCIVLVLLEAEGAAVVVGLAGLTLCIGLLAHGV